MEMIVLFDALVAAGLLILYGTVLVNWWRKPRDRFPALKFGAEPLNARSVKAVWGIVLLTPIAFSSVLAATWLPIGANSETAAVDSPEGARILVEEAWGGGDGHVSEGIIFRHELTVSDDTVTRSSSITLPWFLLVVCAAYAVFVLKPAGRPDPHSPEPQAPNA